MRPGGYPRELNTHGARRPSKRTALGAFIGSIAISALLGIWALMAGGFGELQIKILLSSLSVSAGSLRAMGGAAATEARGEYRIGAPAIVLSGISLALALIGLWSEADAEELWKLTATGGAEAGSGCPAWMFGTTRGAGARGPSYVIAVNELDPDPKTYGVSTSGDASLAGAVYAASHLVNLDGLSVRVEHRAMVDSVTGAVGDEHLSVQGTQVDLAKGRLILLGNGEAADDWIHSSDPRPSAPSGVEPLPEFVANAIANLALSNGVIEAFLRR